MIDIDKVKELVCIGCPYDPEEISLDSELVGDLEMDSFSMLDIVMAFEKEYNISIVENKPLARIIYHNVEIGMEIPPELYYAVAEILASVLRANNR